MGIGKGERYGKMSNVTPNIDNKFLRHKGGTCPSITITRIKWLVKYVNF
jgi:hypothetical protein